MHPWQLSHSARDRLTAFATALIDQRRAEVIVPADEPSPGYWFGGGNCIRDAHDRLLLVGRYRSGGDSRTGLLSGTRGLELSVFQSPDGGGSFQKILSWNRFDLSVHDAEVLSIEGACLQILDGEYRLFVSTEKKRPYPRSIAEYQKPGAGIWTIDLIRGRSLDELLTAPVTPLLDSSDPQHLHVKDPFFWIDLSAAIQPSDAVLGFCTHPFSWTSSNTGCCVADPTTGTIREVRHGVVVRGSTWDVAMTRVTCALPIPRVGLFADRAHTLLFYCGGECVRQLEEHHAAHSRARGYSCEELGGAAVYVDGNLSTLERLSDIQPLFVSPWGTGCSRYVDVLMTPDGFLATWQQSQTDQSQPLVRSRLSRVEAEEILQRGHPGGTNARQARGN